MTMGSAHAIQAFGPRHGWRAGRIAAASVAALAMLASFGGGGAHASSLPALHAARDREIRDTHGREVLLRGVNVTALMDAYQGNPRMPPVVPLRPRDYLQMEAFGFNVIRLAVNWSKLEPERGHINSTFIDRIAEVVRSAAHHGMYTVIDMHQRAWGKYLATPRGKKCHHGLHRSHGWYGAPRWATFTDGHTTCHEGTKKRTPAVNAAWFNFWTNHKRASWTDGRGIQDHLVAVWGALGRAFAGDPAVAGYDLINEPEPGGIGHRRLSRYNTRFYSNSIASIRQGEADARGFSHMVFFEPDLTWSGRGLRNRSPDPGFSNDPNLVFSPHMYGRDAHTTTRPISKVKSDLKRQARRARRRARAYGTPLWIGEWSYSPFDMDAFKKLRAHVKIQDSRQWGTAWWQWKVACGSPHAFDGLNSTPSHHQVGNLNPVKCPSGKPIRRPSGLRAIVARAYPRFAPGTVTGLHARGARMSMRGNSHCSAALRRSDPQACELVVWIPKANRKHKRKPPAINGRHLSQVRLRKVPGGWIATASVEDGSYSLRTAPRHSRRSMPHE
jgi:endoglycosylceramidase